MHQPSTKSLTDSHETLDWGSIQDKITDVRCPDYLNQMTDDEAKTYVCAMNMMKQSAT